MDLISLIAIGVVLSIDSLVASITTGACNKEVSNYYVYKIAVFMAVFQATMPLFGWLIGTSFKSIIESYDHWVAFALLLAIGGKLIYEGMHRDNDSSLIDPRKNLVLCGIALATSIDALVVGIGFGLIDVNIWLAMFVIGVATFIFSVAGVVVGKRIGNKINMGIEIFGGLVLVGLGTKILIEHLYF